MSDTGGGKKPPVEPQAGPGPGRAAGERGLPGSFPLVLKKLMENPPREARLGEGGIRACLGAGFLQGRGLVRAGLEKSEVGVKWSSGGGWGPGMTRGLQDEAEDWERKTEGEAERLGRVGLSREGSEERGWGREVEFV